MSMEFMSFTLLGGMVLLLALGMEIGPAMGIVAGMGLIFFVHQPMDYFARAAFEIMNSFTFTAIPLFVFMGTIYASTGIVGSLFRGAEKIFGRHHEVLLEQNRVSLNRVSGFGFQVSARPD